MTRVQPTLLWEAEDANRALTKRFQFASADDATRWLVDRVGDVYPVRVISIDRLVISSANLLAWLTTDAGHLLVKCCALVSFHQRLQNVATLLHWLAQRGIPVSVPLLTHMGEGQIICDHLSLGVQRVIAGDLLEPTQRGQAQAAGVTLAYLHNALARYPHAADFTPPAPMASLKTMIQTWADKKGAALVDPELVAGLNAIEQRLPSLGEDKLATQLVHNDYRAANLLWHDDQIAAVLDFEELGWGYRLYDLTWAAIHLGTRFHHWGPVAPEVHKAFLDSYTAIHPLTATEQAWLILLLTVQSINLVGSAKGPRYADSISSVNLYQHLLEVE